MGILRKKRKYQSGGSIYGDTRFLVLNADIPMQGPSGGSAQAPRPMTGSGSASKKSGDNDTKNLLPSDIAYYNLKKAAIEQAMEDGIKNDPDFIKSAAYEKLSQAWHALESNEYPQMFNMAKVYTSGKTNYENKGNKAGDEPAILDGQAIVQILPTKDKPETEYAVVGVDELLQLAPNVKLLHGRDVVELRQKDPRFSGFTDAGRIADKLLSRAYGSNMFDEDIQKALKTVGHYDQEGKYYDNTHQLINVEGTQFDEKTYLIKSNITGLNRLAYGLSKQTNTDMSEYLVNSSIEYLYNEAKTGNIDPALFGDKNKFNELITRSIATKIYQNLDIEMRKATKDTKESGSDKKVYSNIFTTPVMSILSGAKGIEIPNINSKDPVLGSIMEEFPATPIPGAQDYFDGGYLPNTGKIKGDENLDKDNRRTVQNNKRLNDVMGSSAVLSTADGRRLQDLVWNNDLAYAVISKRPNFQLILAPTEENERGEMVVNFKNRYIPQMLKATANAYEALRKEGIKPEDVLNSEDTNLFQKFEDISKKEFMDIIKSEGIEKAPVMRLALAFKVQYETPREHWTNPETDDYSDDDPDKQTRHIWAPVDDGAELYSIIEKSWNFFQTDNPQETYAFAVLDNAFWRDIQYQGAVPSEHERSIERSKQSGAIKTKNDMGKLNPESLIRNEIVRKYLETQSKKNGGKLLSTEEFGDILFK